MCKVFQVAATCAVAVFVMVNCTNGDYVEPIGKNTAAFTPASCSSGAFTSFPVDLNITKYQPKSVHNTQHYASNTASPYWPFLFNQNVREIKLQFANFDVKSPNDQLQMVHKYGTAVWQRYLEPNPVEGPYTIRWAQGAGYVLLRWSTGGGFTATGYDIPNIQVKCAASPATPANTVYVHPNAPHDGVFLGGSDVIWVYTTQPAGKEMSFYLQPIRGAISADADFDLFVSTDPANAIPPSSGSVPSAQSSQQWGDYPEMVVLPAPTVSRTVYVGLTSWQGSGRFRFYANIHNEYYSSTMAVTTDFTPNNHHRQVIRNSLYKVAAAAYFGTDGRHLIKNFNVVYNGGYPLSGIKYVGLQQDNRCVDYRQSDTGCQVNFGSAVEVTAVNWCRGGQNACLPSSQPSCLCDDTDQFHVNFAFNVALHEIGHCRYFLSDEDAIQNPQHETCGHSIMSSGWAPSSVVVNLADFCTARNGGLNPQPGTNGHPSSENNWACMEYWKPGTPAFNLQLSPDPFFGYGYLEKDAYGNTTAKSDYPFSRHVTIAESGY